MEQLMYSDKAVNIMYNKVVKDVSYKGYENVDIYTATKTIQEEGKWSTGTDEEVWEQRNAAGWTQNYETYEK